MSNYIKELNEKSFCEWFKNEVASDEDAISDIIVHSVKHAHRAFYRYADTSMLYERYSDEIWQIVNHYAQSLHNCTTVQLLGRDKGFQEISDPEELADCLVCLAATKLAMEYLDERLKESDQEDNEIREEQ